MDFNKTENSVVQNSYKVAQNACSNFDKGMEGGDGFFNLRKLEGLKSFVKWAGYGNNQRGVQYEGVYNYLDAITDSEYKILHQEMLEYIERDLH